MSATIVPTAGTSIPEKALPGRVFVMKRDSHRHPAKRQPPASREAQRFAAAILEVLAGVRTPTDAAGAMGVSVPRYYLWEQRALEGLVAACEPRPVGKVASERHQIAVLLKEVARLKQDHARQQALVRATQRTVGLAPPPQPVCKPGSKAAGKGKHPRKRRPVVRALRAAAALRATAATDETPTVSSLTMGAEVIQRSAISHPSQPAASVSAATAVPET
jgi:hypothetical protein